MKPMSFVKDILPMSDLRKFDMVGKRLNHNKKISETKGKKLNVNDAAKKLTFFSQTSHMSKSVISLHLSLSTFLNRIVPIFAHIPPHCEKA